MGKATTKYSDFFYELWFPKSTQLITIVAPPFEDIADFKLTSPNYGLIDRLGDKDSIFSIGKLLSRKYPKAFIDLVSSEDFNRQSLQKNFVVIGGPGGLILNAELNKNEEFQGNEVCRIFSKLINSDVSYTDDCEKMMYRDKIFSSEYNNKEHMTLDYGYFSAFENPLMKSARVIMIHGIHTLGVLGATRIFDVDESDGFNNLSVLKNFFEKNDLVKYNFETFFKVKVTRGEVLCPVLSENAIFIFGKPTSSEPRNVFEGDNQVDGQILKDEVIDLITIASDNTYDSDRRKDHSGLIEKIKALENYKIGLLQSIKQVCLSNPQIPESKIEKINVLLK